MKLRTKVRAGGTELNHNNTLVWYRMVFTPVNAENGIMAGTVKINHNQAQVGASVRQRGV